MSAPSITTINGEPAAYRDVGRGEVILLIHGMAGSSATWRDVIPELARHHRVLAPDLPGHGASGKPRGDYSLGSFAAWLRDLLDELGIESATVVGQSLGGGVAMQFSYQHPEYCHRLALISSGGLGPDVSWTLRLLAAPGAELLMPVIAAPPVITAGNKVASWLGERGLRAPVRTRCGVRTGPWVTGRPARRSCAPCARWSTIADRRSAPWANCTSTRGCPPCSSGVMTTP